MQPLTITLYDPQTNEVKKEFTRSFVPWGLLKRAVRLQGAIDMANVKEEDIDELAALVVAAFGDQFSVQDLTEGADMGEMVTVLMAIIGRASALMAQNPTRPASQ